MCMYAVLSLSFCFINTVQDIEILFWNYRYICKTLVVVKVVLKFQINLFALQIYYFNNIPVIKVTKPRHISVIMDTFKKT